MCGFTPSPILTEEEELSKLRNEFQEALQASVEQSEPPRGEYKRLNGPYLEFVPRGSPHSTYKRNPKTGELTKD